MNRSEHHLDKLAGIAKWVNVLETSRYGLTTLADGR